MIVVGLTGSIGMGKSTVARQFQRRGVCVCSADAIVHALMAPSGKAVSTVSAAFPAAVDAAGGIDRRKLGKEVFSAPEKRAKLEAILHPQVVAAEEAFARAAQAKGARMVIMDIPLLFETGAQARMDVVVVVRAPYVIQRQRVLARPGMTVEKFHAILAAQMSDDDKCAQADAVIDTGLGMGVSARQVTRLVRQWEQGI